MKGALLFCALCSVAFASIDVVPNVNASSAGNTSASTITAPMSIEYQQLLGGGQLPANPVVITGISFRAAPAEGPVAAMIGSFSLYLSSSPNYPNTNTPGKTLMSSTFANNVGPDRALVFSSTNVVLSDAGCATPGPCPFDIPIPFTTPYYYSGTGPILIDLFETNVSGTSGALDAESFTGPPGGQLAAVVGTLGSPTGTFLYQGNIVQVTYFSAATIVSQIADGGAWGTGLVATNTTTTGPAAFSMDGYQDVGSGATQPWQPPFVEVNSTQNLSLPPGGTLFLHTAGTASNTNNRVVPGAQRPWT